MSYYSIKEIALIINNQQNYMKQSQQKRDQFRNQIRRKQHQQIFKKMRAKAQKSQQNVSSQQLTYLLKSLPQMYSLSDSIQNIVQNQKQIIKFINQIRKFEDKMQIVHSNIEIYKIQHKYTNLHYSQNKQIQEGFCYPLSSVKGQDLRQCALIPLIQYMSFITTLIHQHIMMDIEEDRVHEQVYQAKQMPYAQILLPINYMLINMLSQQLPMSYLIQILKFTKYRLFIDCFHNLFLTENLPQSLKLLYVEQFLGHLEANPVFYLNNCFVFTKIMYYALEQQPKLSLPKFQGVHIRMIKNVDNVYSILSFNNKLQQNQKDEFRKFSFLILQILCANNIKNCWAVVNAENTMKAIEIISSQLRTLFTVKEKLNQGFQLGYMVYGIKLLCALAYYDQIITCMNQYYPLVWINLLSILKKLSLQYWIKSQPKQNNKKQLLVPNIFNLPQFTKIVINTLNCISNFICVPEICQLFIKQPFAQYQNNKSSKIGWIVLLTQIYNIYYKYAQIRVQCLVMFSNVLSIVQKSNLMLFTSQKSQDQQLQSDKSVKFSIIQMLDQSIDLVLQVFKLSNHNKSILLSVASTILRIIERLGDDIKKCKLFRQTTFINRMCSIVNDENMTGRTKNEFYSEDVKLKIHYIMEALMINND